MLLFFGGEIGLSLAERIISVLHPLIVNFASVVVANHHVMSDPGKEYWRPVKPLFKADE
nr:hypothetical protein [Pantoea allii]